MTLLSFLAFIPALLIGMGVILLVWPGPYLRDLPVKFALALGVGPGLVSCLYFAFCLVTRPRSRVYFGLEATLLVGLWIVILWKRKSKTYEKGLLNTRSPVRWITYLLIAGLVGVAGVAATSFTVQTLMQPHGIQDAWNIWNMRARFIFRGGPAWKDLFDPAIYWLNHPDYPFLVTAGSARAWYFLGQETPRAPAVQAGLFSLGLVGILFTGLGSRRSWGSAALAGLLLCASPWFVLYGAWQIADVPLVFFLCASLFILTMILSSSGLIHPGLHFLFGLCCGLAAWTKNEGLFFLVIALTAWLAARLIARTPLGCLWREAVRILLGLALPLAVLFYLKVVIAPPSDLFAGQSAGLIGSRLVDTSRYLLIVQYLAGSIFHLGGWKASLLACLVITALLLWQPFRVRALLFPALAVAALFGGYFVIYLITPHDLVWHLRTSSDRLVFHLFPPILLILFWVVRSPEEIARALFAKKTRTG